MDPNIYFAYLCFLDSDHSAKKAFDSWRKDTAPYTGLWTLGRFTQDICRQQAAKYRQLYIYEAEKVWNDFNIVKFTEFLKGYGFKK